MSQFSTNFNLPQFLQRGKAHTIECPVYLNGALVAPSLGTISIVNPQGVEVVNSSVSIVGSIATYAISASAFNSYSPSEKWQVIWTLTISGEVHYFERLASLVRRVLQCPVSDADVFRRHSNLDPDAENSIVGNLATVQTYIDDAWVVVNQKLIEEGNRPNLISDSSALALPTLYQTLTLIFRDLSTTDGNQLSLAELYENKFTESWAKLSLVYDENNDGLINDGGRRASRQPYLFS